jgi:hypothetical protein
MCLGKLEALKSAFSANQLAVGFKPAFTEKTVNE